MPHVELYFQCFLDTSTERSIGMGVGPIPNTSVISWGKRRGMSPEESETMWRVITLVDDDYLKRQNEKAKQDAKRKHSQPGGKGQKAR